MERKKDFNNRGSFGRDDRKGGSSDRRSFKPKYNREDSGRDFSGDRDNKPFERRDNRDGEFKPRRYNEDGGERGGFRKDFNSERSEGGRSFERRDNRSGGDRKPYGDREFKPRHNNDERGERSFERRDNRDGEFKPRRYNEDGGERGGLRKDFNSDRREGGKSFERRDNRGGGDRKPYGNREFKPRHTNDERGERSFERRDTRDGEFKPRRYNEDGGEKEGFRKDFNSERREGGRSFERRDNRGGGDRKPYGDREFKPRHNNNERSFERRDNHDGGFKPRTDRDDRNNRFDRNDARRPAKYESKTGRTQSPDYGETTVEPLKNQDIRLNRFIAMSGVCSRREADELITSGVITVNGEVITELGAKIKGSDDIRMNGESLRGEKKVYILMNKPKGYVTTLEDPNADKTVMDLLKGEVEERIYPVGRLDKNTLGVLLLTNDGEMTKKLTHPSHGKKKIYHVFLDKAVTAANMKQIAEGIELEDGLVFADEVSYVGDNHKEVGIELHSGRNRIVRRIFEHLGYKVVKLDRVYFAGLSKKGLQRGFWRYLTTQEVAMLKSGTYD